MRFVSFGLVMILLTGPAAGQSRALGGRCKEACNRLLANPRQRAVLCARCLTDAGADRGCWAAALKDESPSSELLNSILRDDDWQVRWGGVRALASIRGFTQTRQLATWINEAHDNLPCLTAVHLAGSQKTSTALLLAPGGELGPSAAGLCWQKKDVLKKALEVDLYSTDPVTRREALLHLATFLEVPPARVVLSAMASRTSPTDESAALLLTEDAEAGGPAAGAAVLKAAGKDDAPCVDRLLAVWSKALDVARPKLKAADLPTRKEAIGTLSAIGPLGAAELEGLLDDPEVSVRLGAARALARGEGKTLTDCAKEKLDPAAKVPEAARIRWAEFLGRSGDPSCEPILTAALGEPKLDEKVRAGALAALGACAGPKALPEVKKGLAAKSPKMRAAALEATGEIARVPEVATLVSNALKDPDPEVLAAAVRACGATHLSARLPEVVTLLEQHPSLEVRLAAVQTVVLLQDSRSGFALGHALLRDSAVEVREAAAKALGELGGPDALSSLTQAVEKDSNSRVKFVAGESLRKLGFARAGK